MENRRTETARDHDDSDIIENAERAPDTVGRAGGNLDRDVGTDAEAERVQKPDGHTRVTKQDDTDNNVRYPRDRQGS